MSKRLLRLMGTASALVLLLLGVVNAFLNTGFVLGKINRRPERLWMNYRAAWMLWPGEVHLRGFEIRGADREIRWGISVERLRARLILSELFERRIHAFGIRGEDGEGWVELVSKSEEAAGSATASGQAGAGTGVPPPEPVTLVPAATPAATPAPEPKPRPGPPPGKPPWRVVLDDIELGGLRQVRVWHMTLRGALRLAGSLDLRPKEHLRLGPLTLTLAGARSGLRGLHIASGLEGIVRFGLDKPLGQPGPKFLPWMSAEAELIGQVESLEFLRFFLHRAPWLQFSGGTGPFEAHVKIEKGKILPGSRLEATTPVLGATLAVYHASGAGHLLWSVDAAGGAPQQARLSMELRDYRMQFQDDSPHVQGEHLEVEATSEDLDLGSGFTDIDVRARVEGAEVLDFRSYNSLFPKGLGFEVEAGRGRLDIDFQGSSRTHHGSVTMVLRTDGVQARFEDLRLTGDLNLRAKLDGNLADRHFDLTGTTVSVEDVTVRDPTRKKQIPGGWWAHVTLRNARLALGRPELLRADLEMELRDLKPVFAVYSRKEDLPGFVQKILGRKRVNARGTLYYGDQGIDVPDFRMKSGPIELLARLRVQAGTRSGILYASHGPLSVGIEMLPDATKLHPIRPKKWFLGYGTLEQAAARAAAERREKQRKEAAEATERARKEAKKAKKSADK